MSSPRTTTDVSRRISSLSASLTACSRLRVGMSVAWCAGASGASGRAGSRGFSVGARPPEGQRLVALLLEVPRRPGVHLLEHRLDRGRPDLLRLGGGALDLVFDLGAQRGVLRIVDPAARDEIALE